MGGRRLNLLTLPKKAVASQVCEMPSGCKGYMKSLGLIHFLRPTSTESCVKIAKSVYFGGYFSKQKAYF